MNGKKSKLLRKMARNGATSHNEYESSSKIRRLARSSLKYILKALKVRYKSTPWLQRHKFC